MSGLSSFTNAFEQSDNVFLKMPHIFKPLQALTAVILAICIGSTAGSENGVLWFVIITSLLVCFDFDCCYGHFRDGNSFAKDQLMDSISNGGIAWNVVELAYSFIFAVLSVISIWLSFGYANQHVGGTSAGYIAAGLFFIIQTALYGIPCYMIYGEVQNATRSQEREITVQPAHPFREVPYQDL